MERPRNEEGEQRKLTTALARLRVLLMPSVMRLPQEPHSAPAPLLVPFPQFLRLVSARPSISRFSPVSNAPPSPHPPQADLLGLLFHLVMLVALLWFVPLRLASKIARVTQLQVSH